MRKMYSGHNKTVEVVRKECDSTGGLIDKVKVFHLMIRRGAYDGMKLVFEDDGNETVRSHTCSQLSLEPYILSSSRMKAPSHVRLGRSVY
jgi:hypothetical protein